MPTEPRYATESWRWVTSEDGLRRKLVAGPELLPLPRVVLECGNLDAEDGIKALPAMWRKLDELRKWLGLWIGDDDSIDLEELQDEAAEFRDQILDLFASARGEGEPDA